ncbi:hypothetical protein STEG23_029565, partial [Scotinomys teguina]
MALEDSIECEVGIFLQVLSERLGLWIDFLDILFYDLFGFGVFLDCRIYFLYFHVGEDVEQEEHFSTVGGNSDWKIISPFIVIICDILAPDRPSKLVAPMWTSDQKNWSRSAEIMDIRSTASEFYMASGTRIQVFRRASPSSSNLCPTTAFE